MPFQVNRIKAKMDQTLILEAAQGTYDSQKLTIANPTWGTTNEAAISSQIIARIVVKVEGVPLSAIGRPAIQAPTFPRMMKLNKRVGNAIELIDK